MSIDQPSSELGEILAAECRSAGALAGYLARQADCSAEDLLQEACLVVLKDPRRLDMNCPTGSFRTILRHVGLNAIYKRYRKVTEAHVIRSIQQQANITDPDAAITPLFHSELADVFRQEISQFPEAQREVLTRELSGETLAESARTIGRSEQVLAKAKLRATERVRESSKLKTYLERLILLPALIRWSRGSESGAAMSTGGWVATAAVVSVATLGTCGLLLKPDPSVYAPIEVSSTTRPATFARQSDDLSVYKRTVVTPNHGEFPGANPGSFYDQHRIDLASSASVNSRGA